MRTVLKGLLGLLVVLVVVFAVVLAAAWWKTTQMLSRHYEVSDPPLLMANDAATLARGAHLYTTLGCTGCHGADGVGQLAFDAGPVGRVIAPNLTPAAIGKRYDADGLAAAIRHGIRADGSPLRIMPSGDFSHLSDTDTAALVAYLQALPPSDNAPGETQIKPFGRVLAMLGKLELTPAENIDHSPRLRVAPVAAATAQYGAYLAAACTGCHGRDFGGQHVPGTPPAFPDAANLTPATEGLKGWQLADFQRALRTGKRPDGSDINGFMPWRAYSQMSDTEIAALWLHFSSLPPVTSKK